jgi:hypothetical protein
MLVKKFGKRNWNFEEESRTVEGTRPGQLTPY